MLWPWLFLLVVGLSVSNVNGSVRDVEPRFKFDPYKCQTLLSNRRRDWLAGCPNSLAVLSSSTFFEYVILHIEMEGAESVDVELKMTVTCPFAETSETLALNKQRTYAVTFCSTQKTPVTVQHDSWYSNRDKHVYRLVTEKRGIPLYKAFRSKVRISVTATVKQKTRILETITSNSLDVYNLHVSTSYLTSKALTFFKTMPYESTSTIPELQFLEPSFMRQLRDGIRWTFFEHLLEIGGILDVASSSCDVNDGEQLLISSSVTNRSLTSSGQIYYFLDLDTGMLTFSRAGIAKLTHRLVEKALDRKSSVCFFVAFGDIAVSKLLVLSQDSYLSYYYAYAFSLPYPHPCNSLRVYLTERVTLYSGFSRSSLKCPIICEFDTPLKFTHNGRVLIQNFRSYDDPYVEQNSLVFPEVIDERHSGLYTCEYPGDSDALKHRFQVTIIALPSFIKNHKSGSVSKDGTLPHTIYRMENGPVSFCCSIFYAGLIVDMTEDMFSLNNDGKWKRMDSGNFYQSSVKHSRGMKTKIYKLNLNKFTSIKSSLRFECVANVRKEDVRALNMDDYSVRSGADIYFIPIPTRKDFVSPRENDCYVQRCSANKGASFKFSLKPEFADYLKNVGVSVSAYFKLDEVSVNVLAAFKRSFVRFDPDADFLLELSIPPISDDNKDLFEELQKRKTLTAVYNFNYNYTIPSNLVLDKSRYGRAHFDDKDDCRLKSSCFYSTNFPALLNDRSLSFLTVDINFMDI